MNDSIPKLHPLGLAIFKTFKSLVDEAWEAESTIHPSRRRIAIEEERFALWAHSLGLHQRGHSSLDHRVRDASIVKAYLADLLGDLKDHLENREFCIDMHFSSPAHLRS